MAFSRRTHTQLKNEHDTKSHETGTRDARARMRHMLRWITAVPASTQPAAATAVVLDAAEIDKRRLRGKVIKSQVF